MEHVHEGILSPNGLSSAINHLERRRRNRYYELLSMFVYAMNRRHTAWLTYTELYSSLCELVMKQSKVKKVLRIDHSVKFCKRLKTGKNTDSAKIW
ncbi:hypothetical protein JG687_00015784 [Phytophthora cactorum]|uniref:Uncharacterized protein n=1 Tax=Phytophthora cactorum TaxID=29920 RepID=A0A8T1TSS6_9STRA|nr:hypothetical protein JG687_00015784 [Phytophthora cactorum]